MYSLVVRIVELLLEDRCKFSLRKNNRKDRDFVLFKAQMTGKIAENQPIGIVYYRKP